MYTQHIQIDLHRNGYLAVNANEVKWIHRGNDICFIHKQA